MAAGDSTKHIIQSLLVNMAIASGKGIGAAVTGSGALLAETIHSGADCANQLLLLLGVKRAAKPPDDTHPLGHGRALYFWSFIVALLLFSGGGVFSIYEGVHKLFAPAGGPPANLWWGIGILVGSIVLEGGATLSNLRELNKRRGSVPFFRFLGATKDSDLVVVFGENSAATVGLVLALLALVVTELTGDPKWDAIGTLLIGGVLIAVAIFLAVEIKSLLVGESADAAIAEAARELAREQPHFERLLEVITVQQGPGEVIVAIKARLSSDIMADEVCEQINEFEKALRARFPEVKWCFVEPDLAEGETPFVSVRGASEHERAQILAIARATAGVAEVTQLLSMRKGPDKVLLALKVRFPQGVRIEEVEAIIDNLERRIRDELPQMKTIWVEADGDFDDAAVAEG